MPNLFYLWRYEDNWQRVNAWIAVAGIGLAAAGATFIGQYNEDIIASSEDQLARLVSVAAPVRYSLSATHFWAALVALMVLTFWHHQRSNPDEIKLWQRSLIIGNVVFASLLGGVYMRETAWSLQFQSMLTGETIADDVGSRSEACFRQVALTRDPCWADTGEFDFFFDKNYKLAYYGLAHFRDHQAIPLLPPVYVEGSPVVIDTPAIWMNAYLRRWYLVGVGEANLFHIAPPADSIGTLADPLTDTAPDYSGDTPARLTAFIDRSATVWYLRTDETASNEAIFTRILADLDYVPTVVPNSDYRINLHLTLIRFDKSPELLDESIPFGDAIRMVSWRIRAEDAESPACQPLTVQTWWQASETLTGNHQIRVTLVYEDGSIISESAGGLTTVPNPFWEPDQLYLDERVFSVTCDLSPGRYDLAVQVNEVDTGQPPNAGPGAILRDWMLPN